MRAILLSTVALLLSAPAALAQTPAPTPTPTPAPAAQAPVAAPADVASIDAIVAALYDVISGEAGAPRDWDRFHSLFAPNAIMGATGRTAEGELRMRIVSPADYVTRNAPHFAQEPFYEREIGRRVQRFGPVIQILSAYEIRNARDAAEPVMRGVNAIGLFDDGKRLWISSITWAGETPATPIPADLLTAP